MSLNFFALLLPEMGKACRSAQFQRLCLLRAGNFNRFQKARFGFGLGVRGWRLGVGQFRL